MLGYPYTRLRRNRQNDWLRDLVAENYLSVSDLILPVFIIEGSNKKEEISSMPGVYRLSIDLLLQEVAKAEKLGIKAILLFPAVDKSLKTDDAKEAYNSNNLICRAIREIKKNSRIGIICDVALDPYTSHGHDGLLINDYVDNDKTVEVLCKQSQVLAEAGCDIIAPSDMMDGRIRVIREFLDKNSYINVGILAYSAKYASSFYGPFRDAVGSKANLGKASKLTYQMDPRNGNEALREIELDIVEGADMIMVKPAMAYLDIISRAKEKFLIPIFAYQVSGEYSMIKAASNNGWLDYNATMIESLISIKRAGAKSILTYAALEVAEFLCKNTH